MRGDPLKADMEKQDEQMQQFCNRCGGKAQGK